MANRAFLSANIFKGRDSLIGKSKKVTGRREVHSKQLLII